MVDVFIQRFRELLEVNFSLTHTFTEINTCTLQLCEFVLLKFMSEVSYDEAPLDAACK